jgi:hypothetical protein
MDFLLENALPPEKIIKTGNCYLFPIEDEKYGKLWYQLNFYVYEKINCVYFELSLIKDGEYIGGLTGTGHTKQVYSTGLNITISFIKNNLPNEVCFSGKKDHAKFNRFYARAVAKYFPEYNLVCYDDINLYLYIRKDIEKSYIQNVIEMYGEDIKNLFMEEENEV